MRACATSNRSCTYGHGLAEHRLGDFLRGVLGDEVVVSTKIGRLLTISSPRESDAGAVVRRSPVRYDFDYEQYESSQGTRT